MQIVFAGANAGWTFIVSVSNRTSLTPADIFSEMQSLQTGRPRFAIRKATILSRRTISTLILFHLVEAKMGSWLEFGAGPCSPNALPIGDSWLMGG
jgi:hypothetical protein